MRTQQQETARDGGNPTRQPRTVGRSRARLNGRVKKDMTPQISTQPQGRRTTATTAVLAAAVLAGIASLQVALAVGAPWGGIAWGGVEDGQLSEQLRVASAVAAVVLTWMALVLLTRGGVIPKTRVVPSRYLRVETWAIAGLMAINTLGNLASGNPFEQLVFAPATALLTALAVYLAMRGVDARA